ncbi:hypothetical protein N7468_008304 [Penicillium chermesinum]|uniref:Chromatin assembly factor 1 subunit A n=1 Tax=Penicillium chermesinum TaxID=63820 RepID=A0A9W9NPI3_9EURO|nr:uncharacterized protein N7468_008304 [Penicillium chermesinum]KAJ5223762.1 hypothetical protein N7468_008304 [Penicillium chermesinum]
MTASRSPLMESNMTLSPLPPPASISASPSSPRKRSINEVDDAVISSVGHKRPNTSCTGENQENQDPSTASAIEDQSTTPNKETATHQTQFAVVLPASASALFDLSPPVTDTVTMTPANAEETGGPASKRQKVSPASKDVKQQEKEAKERQRLEEKAKKDEEKRLRADEKKKRDAEREEEKRVKEEEKKKRDAEREEEKRLKEEEKKRREAEREERRRAKEEEKAAKEAAKEDEKRRKEEEKQKKERAQPKLNSFFAKPPPPTSPAKSANSPSKPQPNVDPVPTPVKSSESDYSKEFPEFFVQSHTTVAPPHRFQRDELALKHVRQTLDASLDPSAKPFKHTPFRPSEVFNLIPYRRRQGRQGYSAREIMRTMQEQNEQEHTGAQADRQTKKSPQKMLLEVQMKSLKFCEDVRPPYQGTYTRAVPPAEAKKMSRNPYHKGLPETNYEYDSEAEWEEPEEGEDLDSEEEEEGSEDGDEEMDDFLDDEDDALAGGKRRQIVGDLEPVCSGIRWAADGVDEDMKVYQIETISETVRFPIDPWSTSYWETPKPSADPAQAKAAVFQKPAAGPLDKFRSTSGDAPPLGLAEFKQAVEGSDLTKIGLMEHLKKRFPKIPKDTLKVTLEQVAKRVGEKQTEKRWVCNP